MLQQIQTKYMIALRQGTELRPEDLGAVRLAMRMAMDELHLQYRHDLADMDDIIADLIQQRDQLKAAAATDAGEILRLQTMEDRLSAWLSEYEPELAFDNAYERDVAAAIIDLLNKRGSATVAPPPIIIEPHSPAYVNGNGNGHVQITNLSTRYTGRRLNVDDDQLRTMAITKIQQLAAQLGRTPSQKDWNANIQPDEPSLTSVKNRLSLTWNDLIVAAGLTPNDGLVAMREAKKAKKEAKAENAEAPFRGQ